MDGNYGSSLCGGITFDEDARQVPLSRFCLHDGALMAETLQRFLDSGGDHKLWAIAKSCAKLWIA
jgi:hypothetical protein